MDQQRSCLTCGSAFEVPPSSTRKFCGPGCWTHPNGHSRTKRPPVTLKCAQCGESFERPVWEVESRKAKGWALYCSTTCRDTARRGRKGEDRVGFVTLVCPKCAGEFQVKPHESRRRRYCSRECARWTGGRLPEPKKRTLTVEGYVTVYVPPAERAPGKEKRTREMEHRVVMAQVMGRHLLPYESVHHINGDKTDNRPENLQLRIGSHGYGISLRCRCCGSSDIETVELAS